MANRGEIDVPVNSYGIYLGLLGKRTQQIILCQNSFCYADGVYDVDYTAIPLSWTFSIKIIQPAQVSASVAQCLLNSFLMGRARRVKRRTSNHENY